MWQNGAKLQPVPWHALGQGGQGVQKQQIWIEEGSRRPLAHTTLVSGGTSGQAHMVREGSSPRVYAAALQPCRPDHFASVRLPS